LSGADGRRWRSALLRALGKDWMSLADETCFCPTGDWPIGALAVANLFVSEAFKTSMPKLRRFASNPEIFDMLFAPTPRAIFALAPDGTPTSSELGRLDVVSGGAIACLCAPVLSRHFLAKPASERRASAVVALRRPCLALRTSLHERGRPSCRAGSGTRLDEVSVHGYPQHRSQDLI